MRRKAREKTRRSAVGIWLRTWAVLGAAATAAFVGGAWLSQRSAEARARIVAVTYADATETLFEKRVESKVSSIRALARDPELMRFARSESAELRAEIEARWSALVEEDARVIQVRFLDSAGMERLRVDRRGGRAEVTPLAGLQDKSQRGYFSLGVRLEPGQLGLSAIELNRERGVIETPWRPTFRAVRPLHGVEGELLGLVVVNFDARPLLDLVIDAPQGNSAALYSDRGHCLSGCGTGKAFSADLGRPPALPTLLPRVWAWVDTEKAGERVEAGEMYVLRPIALRAGPFVTAWDPGMKLLVHFERPPMFSTGSVALWAGMLVLLADHVEKCELRLGDSPPRVLS